MRKTAMSTQKIYSLLLALSLFQFATLQGCAAGNSVAAKTPEAKKTTLAQKAPPPLGSADTKKSTEDKKTADIQKQLIQAKPSSWKYQNEEEWLVDFIGRDIAEIILFAASSQGGKSHTVSSDSVKFTTKTVNHDAEEYNYTLEAPPLVTELKRDFALEKCIFGTTHYAAFAKQLMDNLKLQKRDAGQTTPSPSPTELKLLERLSDGNSSTIYEENDRLSRELSKDPLNPDLHEQAALLMCAFGLIQLNGRFHDVRLTLARITAHLAIAEALRDGKPQSVCGQLAAGLLPGMSSRDAETVARAEELEKQDNAPIVKAWVRALKIIGTNDYRIMPKKGATPIEEFEYGRRLAAFVDGNEILSFLSKRNKGVSLRWMRIGQNGRQTVESGHVFMKQAMDAEFDDFYADYKRFQFKSFSDFSKLPAELNQDYTGCLSSGNGDSFLQIISWPDVAYFHARAMLSGYVQSSIFYNESFGDKEKADLVYKQAKQYLSGLKLFPFCYKRISKDPKEDHSAEAADLIRSRPDLVNGSNWLRFAHLKPGSTINPLLWFNELPLFGTAMNFYIYTGDDIESPKLDLARLTHYRELATFNYIVCRAWTLKKYGEKPTAEQWKEGFGKMMEFYLPAMEYVAEAYIKDPPQYIAEMEKLAQWKPSKYFHIANYCFVHNDIKATEKYSELGVTMGTDDVAIANNSRWLVNYWYNHGQRLKAEAIADRAAEVYSAMGLETRALLSEREGKPSEAEDFFRQIKERYNTSMDLTAFYMRHSADNSRFAALARQSVAKDFPQLRTAVAADLAKPPGSGVVVTSVDDLMANSALKIGDVITEVMNYHINNENELNLILRVNTADHIRITYWNGKKYSVLNTILINYEMPYATATYKPGSTAK